MKTFFITVFSFLFLGVGAAWSQTATNLNCPGPCVDTGEIRNGAVRVNNINNNAVTSDKILNQTIVNDDISDTAAIDASKIAGGSGSGLDADTVDGIDSTVLLKTDEAISLSHDITTTENMAVGTNDTSGYNFKVHGTTGLVAPAHNAWSLFGLNTIGNVNWQLGSWDNDVAALGLSDADNNRNILLLGEGNSYFNGGNVGIGTSSPEAKLHVAGDLRLYGGAGSYGIYLEPAGTNNVGIHKLSNEGAPWKGSFVSFGGFTPATADLLLLGYEGVSLGTREGADVLGLRVTSAGQVGVGTTAPNNKLQVVGGGFFNAEGIYVPGGALVDANGLRLEHDDALNESDAVGLNVAISRAAPAVALKNNTGPAMVVEAGNTGFGTTAPTEKIDVAGNIKLSGNILSDGDICIGDCE